MAVMEVMIGTIGTEYMALAMTEYMKETEYMTGVNGMIEMKGMTGMNSMIIIGMEVMTGMNGMIMTGTADTMKEDKPFTSWKPKP